MHFCYNWSKEGYVASDINILYSGYALELWFLKIGPRQLLKFYKIIYKQHEKLEIYLDNEKDNTLWYKSGLILINKKRMSWESELSEPPLLSPPPLNESEQPKATLRFSDRPG